MLLSFSTEDRKVYGKGVMYITVFHFSLKFCAKYFSSIIIHGARREMRVEMRASLCIKFSLLLSRFNQNLNRLTCYRNIPHCQNS
jgi:hypothetical protein